MTERDVTDPVLLTEKAITHLLKAFKDRQICSVETLREVVASHRLLQKRVTQLEQEIGALMR